VHDFLIPAKRSDDSPYVVLKNTLGQLIRERKILQFRRSDGWVRVEEDHRKGHGERYSGPERRVSRMIDGDLFSLPVEEQVRKGLPVEAILGYGQRAREVAEKLRSVATTNLSVLIQGKTGTGKGVTARILHELSKRKDKPFIRVDCGAIPPTLIESELFGHEKGSFTGAFRSKPGRFHLANGGTMFLDEIGNLTLDLQTRLLGFLEERVVNAIGGVTSVRLDVRVVSATNADPMDRIRRGEFREDLFYRLNEFEIRMPPLEERADDIYYLATKFLMMANAELGKQVFGFSEQALEFLSGYAWKGNIRELKNVIKKATLFADEVIEREHLLVEPQGQQLTSSLDALMENAYIKGYPLSAISEAVRKEVERRIIERAYTQCHGNKTKTCALLGIDYSTLYRKTKELGLHLFRIHGPVSRAGTTHHDE